MPSHVNEGTEPVDNLGGVLSIVMVAALVLAINFAPVPNKTAVTLMLVSVVAVAGRRCCSSCVSAAPATRCTTSKVAAPARLLGRGAAPGSSCSAA